MKGAQIIVLATPVFLLLIAIEYTVGRARGRDTYRAADAMSSIGLGMLGQVTGVFAKALTVGIYTLLYDHIALAKLPVDAWWVWAGALIAYDFFYYWHHRLGHRVAQAARPAVVRVGDRIRGGVRRCGQPDGECRDE